MRLPEDYGWAHPTGDVLAAFACSAAGGWLESVLAEGRPLYDWGARHAVAEALLGRGPVRVAHAPVPGPDRRERWAFRHYRRGGAAAPLLGDLYLRIGERRPVRELRVSVEARARGVPTPAVVAGAAYRSGAAYRADLVTELVPGAVSLRDAMFGAEPARDAIPLLRSAGRLVRALEQARVLHADLNAGNVLIDAGGGPGWVVDLDRCGTLRRDAPPPVARMRRRLERSLRKLAELHARPLTPTDWAALRSGFEEAS